MESSIYRQKLLADADARTFQRAVFGHHPPGSTFKPITALSALREMSSFQEKYTCAKGYRNERVDRCDAGFTPKEAPTARLICKKH